MNTVVKRFECCGKTYAIIEDTQAGRHFYGTISYEHIDSQGKLTKVLNGFDMCIADTLEGAIEDRRIQGKVDRFKENRPDATTEEFYNFLTTLYK